ncbi:hypothetical protein MIND_00370900 [Mycena indigotica]|uniref:Condensation domain-containing protein n=1 Tax=Mycena indigotica TaxID=2126181 RepID=A0A8H6T2S3_9AGAR|nr:uncharacterized protein MIND_00370900 [Mycena indigotica]KAF7309981.1 hypothetical protein MIND_00370900 [Mycena indigotica]
MTLSWTALNRPDGTWTELGSAPNRVYQRSLGLTESAFYWDGEAAGTADVVERSSIRNIQADEDRFREIWKAVKTQFPLVGARVEELDPLQFVIEETRLRTIAGKQEFHYIANADATSTMAALDEALNGRPRRLDCSTLVGVTVLHRTDLDDGSYDIITVGAHLILDGIASFNLARTIGRLASSWPSLHTTIDLPKRLEMLPSVESLHTNLQLSLPRQRWRRAIAGVIFGRRASMLRFGHTLPRKWSAQSPRAPAHSSVVRAKLAPETTPKALAACRLHGVTFGNALYTLGQVAMSRVLHRRVKRGELPLEEWDSRLKSPMHTGGPVNLRQFVVPEWHQAGGTTEINLCIGFFVMSLPFLPHAPLADKSDPKSFVTDATLSPSFPSLLSRERFWYRTNLARQRALATYRHPLFSELLSANTPARIARGRVFAEAWRKLQAGEEVEPLPELAADAMVFTHIAASMGVMDTDSSSDLHLRCRPGELYVGAKTIQGVTELWVFYDRNTYQEEVVHEWLDEICQGLAHYLVGVDS